MSYRVSSIRWPDEFRYALNSISENFPAHAELSDDHKTIHLRGLSPEQCLAFDIFMLTTEADDVISNLNMVMSDLERLSETASAFGDRNPFSRFQFLVRMFFYEYGRLEDAFGQFTLWKQRQNLLTKAERKAEREAFYKYFEAAIRTRNLMMHDAVSWEQQCSLELGLLQGASTVGHRVVDREGVELEWDAHIRPLCERTLPMLLVMAQEMQVWWNMQMAHLALTLVEGGRLTRATKPYVGRDFAKFLKANPNYR